MKRRTIFVSLGICLAVLAIWAVRRHAEHGTNFKVASGVPIKLILTAEQFRELGGYPREDFDVTDDSFVMIVDGKIVVLQRKGGSLVPVKLTKQPAGLQSLALDADGAVLTLTASGLGQFTTEGGGGIAEVAGFPAGPGARLAPATRGRHVFLYGGTGEQGFGNKVVEIGSDGNVTYVARTESPVTAICDGPEALYFATGDAIFAIHNDKLQLIIRLPEGSPAIVSLAVQSDGGVYFATSDGVWLLRNKIAVEVLNGLGGTLRERNGVLYVLDPSRRVLVQLGRNS